MRLSPIAKLCLSFPISKPAQRWLREVSGSPEARGRRQTGFAVSYLQTRGTPKSPKRDPSELCLEPRGTILSLCPKMPHCTPFPTSRDT